MNVVLLEPEIPYNTGAVGRTCAASGTTLHLIRPFGFSVDEKSIKRAGLDYWQFLNVNYYDNYDDFITKNPNGIKFFATTKSQKIYTDAKYDENCYLIFGRESAGLPEELLVQNPQTCVRIPMLDEARSLNLSVSVGILLFEALRQNAFPTLQHAGNLHRLSW